MPARPVSDRRDDERQQLVALRCVADEAGAGFVLADRDQHLADGRAVEAPQEPHHQEGDYCDQDVVVDPAVETQAEVARPGDAAEAVLAAGHRGPAEGDDVEHRRQGERQQREIDAAPAQDQHAEQAGNDDDEADRQQHRQDEAVREQVALCEAGGVGGKAEPGAVAERDEAGVADQHVERHAGDGEDHHLGRRGHGEADRRHDQRQGEQPGAGDEQWQAVAHRGGGDGRRGGRAGVHGSRSSLEPLDALAEQAARA